MATRSLNEHLQLVDATLRQYEHLFADSVHPKKYEQPGIPVSHPVKVKRDNDYKLQTFNWPKALSRDTVGGFRLRDGMGFVAIHKQFAFKHEHDAIEEVYSYKFFSRDHEYIYCHMKKELVSLDYFTFRYDKDIKDPHQTEPDEHIQILGHSMPRIITRDIALEDFLQVVQDTCFTQVGSNKWNPRHASLHSNR